jgi:hypothetical protein
MSPAAGGVIYFFHHHRGKPIASPALFEPIGEKFRRDIRDWARTNGIPLIAFRAGDRKADVMGPVPGCRRGLQTLAGGGGGVRAGVPAGLDSAVLRSTPACAAAVGSPRPGRPRPEHLTDLYHADLPEHHPRTSKSDDLQASETGK